MSSTTEESGKVSADDQEDQEEEVETKGNDDDGETIITPDLRKYMDECVVMWQTNAVTEHRNCCNIMQYYNHRGVVVIDGKTETHPGSMCIYAKSKSNMVLAHWNITRFDFFHCDVAQYTVPVKLRTLYETALRSATGCSAMRWSIRRDELEWIRIELAASSKSAFGLAKVRTLDLSNVPVMQIDIDRVWPRCCTMKSADWTALVKRMVAPWKSKSAEAQAVAVCEIETNEYSITFRTHTNDSFVEQTINADTESFRWIQIAQNPDKTVVNTKTTLFIQALESTHKTHPARTVEVYLSNTEPLVLRYDLITGTFRVMVAPVIDPGDNIPDPIAIAEHPAAEVEVDEDEDEDQPSSRPPKRKMVGGGNGKVVRRKVR